MAIERNDIEFQVKSVISSKFGIEASEIKGNEKLIGELGLDSLDLLTVQETLEERLDVQIPDDDLPESFTVNGIVDALYQALVK